MFDRKRKRSSDDNDSVFDKINVLDDDSEDFQTYMARVFPLEPLYPELNNLSNDDRVNESLTQAMYGLPDSPPSVAMPTIANDTFQKRAIDYANQSTTAAPILKVDAKTLSETAPTTRSAAMPSLPNPARATRSLHRSILCDKGTGVRVPPGVMLDREQTVTLDAIQRRKYRFEDDKVELTRAQKAKLYIKDGAICCEGRKVMLGNFQASPKLKITIPSSIFTKNQKSTTSTERGDKVVDVSARRLAN